LILNTFRILFYGIFDLTKVVGYLIDKYEAQAAIIKILLNLYLNDLLVGRLLDDVIYYQSKNNLLTTYKLSTDL